MSRRDNMKRIFVGNLPPDVRSRDLEDLFYKFGKIAFIDLKTRRGPPFAFVEFHDYRDAEEAVRARDGKKFDGYRLRVEFPRGRERPSRFKNGSGGTGRSSATQKHSKFRVKVTGLPVSGSWQDLKDHMREFGEVCFADVYKGGEGVVEFVNYDDMRYAIRKLNNTKFKSHEGESSYIKLREDIPHSRSRSPRDRSRSRNRSRSRSRSPVYDKSPVRSYRRGSGDSRSRSRSRTPRDGSRSRSPQSRSVSRSPVYESKKSPAHSDRRSSHSRSRSRTPDSRSRSSRSPPSPSHDKSPAHSESRRSNSRTPTPVEDKD